MSEGSLVVARVTQKVVLAAEVVEESQELILNFLISGFDHSRL